MKGKVVFLALLLSVALCSQGFGGDLLDRMLGLNCGGCGGCNTCDKAACCEEVKDCAPEPECCEEVAACGKVDSCDPCGKKRCDLFAGLKDLFDCKRCDPCGKTECCEEVAVCAPEPECCEEIAADCCDPCGGKGGRKPLLNLNFGFGKNKCGACGACEKEVACCEEEVACCEEIDECGGCGKGGKRPLLDLLDDLFGGCNRNKGCGACEEVADCGGCGGGGGALSIPAEAPTPVEEAAPLPSAPQPDDESAASPRLYPVHQTSRSIIRY